MGIACLLLRICSDGARTPRGLYFQRGTLLQCAAMIRRTLLQHLSAAPLIGLALGQKASAAEGASSTVYELRIYHTYEGKLDDLLRRFRDHTTKLLRNTASRMWPIGCQPTSR